MTGEPRTPPARPQDRNALLELVETTFGSDGFLHRAEFWTWKHERNPFGPSPIRVAEVEGEIVALRAFLRWRFRCGDQDVAAVRAVDTATREDWRGRGLFTRLTQELADELRYEGIGLVFNTPNEKSRPGYLAMGWRKVARVPVWTRLRSLSAGSGDATGKRSSGPGEPVAHLLRHPGLPGLLEAVAEGAGGTGERRYRTPRSLAYLAWRYRDIPGFGYRTLYDLEGDWRCALIYRTRQRGRRRELDMAEILVPRRTGAIRRAAGLLRRLARESAVDHLVGCAPVRSPEAGVLWRAGFLPIPWVGPRLVAHGLASTPTAPAPERWSHWHLGLGDLEIF